MSYRFRPAQRADKEIPKVALERLDRAIEALSVPEAERAEGVHDARKRLKELRALLRLVRQPLGKKTFKEENRCLRDAGRMLSHLRDAAATVESWDALVEAYPKDLSTQPAKRVRQRLVERAERTEAEPNASAIDAVLAELDQRRRSVLQWQLSGRDFKLFAEGLEDSYRAGRKAMAAAEHDPSDENLHEWRKRVKDQWYQTRLLVAGWPAMLKARRDQLKKLAKALGDDHDLAMLQQLIIDEPDLFGEPELLARISQCIIQRRCDLQAQAFSLGSRLYFESPVWLCTRLRHYWKLARKETLSAP